MRVNLILFQSVQKPLGTSGDRGERIVYLMSDAGCHLPKSRKPLIHNETDFSLFFLRYIFCDEDGSKKIFLGGIIREIGNPQHLSRLLVPYLIVDILLISHTQNMGTTWPTAGSHKLVTLLVDFCVWRYRNVLMKRPVCPGDIEILINDGNKVRDTVKRFLPLLLRSGNEPDLFS